MDKKSAKGVLGMKKLLSTVCIISMIFLLSACGSQRTADDQTGGASASQPSSAQNSAAIQQPETKEDETNILVAYFSATGNTKALAEFAADAAHADIYEIVPETPYTDEDLDYGNDQSRTSLEMNDSHARPAISGGVENMEQYDILLLGYPIWWGQAPRIMSTFLESYDFSGKTIVPFCTSGSSDIGSSAQNLHALTDPATTWLDGARLRSNAAHDDIAQWINSLDLGITAE